MGCDRLLRCVVVCVLYCVVCFIVFCCGNVRWVGWVVWCVVVLC
jgi:hypothetical protein